MNKSRKNRKNKKKAIVKDVLRGQDTLSSLRTFVQLLHLDPSAPFKTAIVDYDNVVKQK